ncbi:hypothetical protein NQ314_005037, partial [Rhamnusium bicolor]
VCRYCLYIDFFFAGSQRQLFMHFYNAIRKKPIHNFWKDVLESQEYLDLTNESKFAETEKAKEESPKNDSLLVKDEINSNTLLTLHDIPMDVDNDRLKVPEESACEVHDSDSECEIVNDSLPKDINCDSFNLKIEPEDSELFCVKRTLGTQDYIGQRVLQIATILRNLSFIEENVPVLVKNTSFVRFLLLCSTSQWNVLRNLGMDMLGNIAADFIVKDLATDLLASNLIKIVTKGLESQDRASCISSLEVLNKLSQNEQNEDVLLRSLESHVYRNVCSFLTIHDVMLLIYTLECLYSLSSLGERSCNLIVNNHGVIDTLVSLVTVEGKSYGPKACIGMKLVETLPSGTTTSQAQSQAQTQQTTTPSTTSPASSTVTTTTTTTSTPIVTSAPATKAVTPSTPARPVQIAPQRLITLTPTSTTTTTSVTVSQTITPSMTPQQLIQQQHAHQQAIHENEQFALAWLRATYEPCSTGKIDHQELYKHYMNSCSKIGRRGVISPLHFPRCVRSVFGGTVGPNPMKPTNPNDPQYYEGIKVRAQPLIISIQSTSIPKTNSSTKGQQVRRKSNQTVVVTPTKSPALTVVADNNATDSTPISPASPILKAQLSAPPKQRESVVTPITSKGDMKSQLNEVNEYLHQSNRDLWLKVMAHPHLSQALLGSTGTTSTTTITMSAGPSKESQAGQGSSTSLIKSLLATKVAARQQQQRLLAQQGNTPDCQHRTVIKTETPKTSRLNGARQLFVDSDIGDPSVSSTTQFASTIKGKKEPPQPPPPPLAPLSNNVKGKTHRIDNEDSDSIGNNSLASSSGLGTVGIGGISSTEDGDNSLTSFEGLLNGIPNMENPLNEDSNSKDSVKIVSSEISINKPLRLADLLEKKFEKSPPMLNGVLGKELRLGERALDLVENHIEKALSRDNDIHIDRCIESDRRLEESTEKFNLKRSASEEIVESEPKKLLLSSNVNGSSKADSPAPESVSSSNSDEAPTTVSTAAAKLFADMAADILEDEDEEQLLQEAQTSTQIMEPASVQIPTQSPLQQIIVDNNQQVLLTQPRQIIVSQPQMQQTNQVVISAGNISAKEKVSSLETRFKSANEVYLHVCAAHCPTGSEEITCQWDRCDNMKRKRFSLMTHLHDKHCNTEAMKQGLVRRKQSAHGAKVEPPPPPSSNPHPGYAPDAALHAIKRHALEFVNPKELQVRFFFKSS